MFFTFVKYFLKTKNCAINLIGTTCLNFSLMLNAQWNGNKQFKMVSVLMKYLYWLILKLHCCWYK